MNGKINAVSRDSQRDRIMTHIKIKGGHKIKAWYTLELLFDNPWLPTKVLIETRRYVRSISE